VARGDLGVEIPTETVPMVQKRLIHLCNAAGKPVITATQMLDSMIRNPRPTRAEASDVANAILDGTDAVMLSGETANGLYPLEAVETMVRIAAEVENAARFAPWHPPAHVDAVSGGDVTDAVAHATCETACDLRARAIITATTSGRTARTVCKYRPHAVIIAVTPTAIVQRQLMLCWGVVSLDSERVGNTDQLIDNAVRRAVDAGLVAEGDRVVLTAGVAAYMPGTTNLMRVETVRVEHETGPS
jgi:pyruvate kinase